MFDPPTRYGSFGEALVRIQIQGIRCHKNTIIEVDSPITAICGLNGTGKSTALQLAAIAYRNEGSVYYVRDFMVEGPLDPAPFAEDASVEYQFWQNDRTVIPRTLSRNHENKRWNGYRRRLSRPVFFTGIGQYLPKIEQHDFIVNNANELQVSDSRLVSDDVKHWICNVLACDYEEIKINTVHYRGNGNSKTGQVVSVQRAGRTYSESHMGFGEGRTQYLISALENLPNQSLVLIEEPETSLHPSAQYQFALYLMDVVIRKHHQVFLTTHSPFILKALPSPSRVYLKRNGDQIDVLKGLSAAQIRSLLAEGNEKALDVLVEDDCAAAILRELIRQVDVGFLQSIEIIHAGEAQTIVSLVKALGKKLPVVGVLDPEQKSDIKNNIFCLPGEKIAPERLLFSDPHVRQHMQDMYGINLADFMAQVSNLDHHGWFSRLAQKINQTRDVLLGEFARTYASAHETEAYILTQQLKDTLK
jgi:predicted ATPase